MQARKSTILKRDYVKPVRQTGERTRCSIIDPLNGFWLPTIALAYPERLEPARMRAALEQVLGDFGSMAGRIMLKADAWHIKHGVGAVFEIAESAERRHDLCAAARAGDLSLACPTISRAAILLGKGPVFAARVTHTPDGSVLGVRWNHAIGDYSSMMLLLRAWSLACRQQPYERPLEVADRDEYLNQSIPAVLTDAPAAASPLDSQWRVDSWSNALRAPYMNLRALRGARRVVFDFSWSQLAAIQATAAIDPTSVSLADALCAYFFWTAHRLDADIGRYLLMTVNYRKKLGLPSNLMGNFSELIAALAKPGDGPADIATSLRNQIDALSAESLTQRALERIKASHSGFTHAFRLSPPGESTRIRMGLTNLSRAGHSSVVFASARPTFVHARPGMPLVGAGVILPSPDSTGLSIDAVLPGKLADRLQRDRAWMSPQWSSAPALDITRLRL